MHAAYREVGPVGNVDLGNRAIAGEGDELAKRGAGTEQAGRVAGDCRGAVGTRDEGVSLGRVVPWGSQPGEEDPGALPVPEGPAVAAAFREAPVASWLLSARPELDLLGIRDEGEATVEEVAHGRNDK